MPLFKDLSDAALADAIRATRSAIYVNGELRRKRGMARLMRDLDIAVAVKRSRMRAGTWTGADVV